MDDFRQQATAQAQAQKFDQVGIAPSQKPWDSTMAGASLANAQPATAEMVQQGHEQLAFLQTMVGQLGVMADRLAGEQPETVNSSTHKAPPYSGVLGELAYIHASRQDTLARMDRIIDRLRSYI